MTSDVLYEKLISENLDKGTQLRLVVNEFRGEQYLHLRKYFLSYEGEWIPTSEGATMVATLQSIYSLLDGLVEICSNEESIDSINQHFSERLNVLKQNRSISK
jgi:hypothetical protein